MGFIFLEPLFFTSKKMFLTPCFHRRGVLFTKISHAVCVRIFVLLAVDLCFSLFVFSSSFNLFLCIIFIILIFFVDSKKLIPFFGYFFCPIFAKKQFPV